MPHARHTYHWSTSSMCTVPHHPIINTTTKAVAHSAIPSRSPVLYRRAAHTQQLLATSTISLLRHHGLAICADAGLADGALVGVVLQPGHNTVLMEGVEAGQVQQLVPGLIVALTHRAGGAAATRRWQHMAAARCQQAAWQQTVTLRGLLDINDVA
jgi:hypothetical protein